MTVFICGIDDGRRAERDACPNPLHLTTQGSPVL